MYAISADYFGVFSQMVQRMRGEEFVAMLANGACGDVIMYDAMRPHKKVNKFFGHAERVAALVAAKAIWAWNQMDFHRSLKLAAAREELTIPRRRPKEEEVEFARRLMSGEATPRNMTQYTLKYFFGPRMEEFQSAPSELKTWVQVLAIGDLAAIVGLPDEIFVEHGLRIKRESPFRHTFVIELANDGWPNIGYVPTAKAFEEAGPLETTGSYETTIGASALVPEGGDLMVESALRMLRELHP
jgi:neutral ceramidase